MFAKKRGWSLLTNAEPERPSAAEVADRFRRLTVWLVLASAFTAVALTIALRVRVDPRGSAVVEWAIAALLLVSRIWWDRMGYHRLADASGTIGIVSLSGMCCGAIAMLELRLRFPMTDAFLQSLDHALGIDPIAILAWLAGLGRWTFAVMAPAYNFTIPIFFASLVALSVLGDRVEAWRAALGFAGTLLTTCAIAAFLPAKGLAVWASPALLAQLPVNAMQTFWPHFDEFYSGADPVLRLQVIDGVVAFPSFHAAVGFLTVAMWRRHRAMLALAGLYLAVMLVATLPGGGHYVVDLIGGFAVWAAWFVLARRTEVRPAIGRTGVESAPQSR